MASAPVPRLERDAESSAGIIHVAINAPRADSNPLANQSVSQLCAIAFRMDTSTADTAIPIPTPANNSAFNPGRPRLAMKSSSSALAKTSTNALAVPPAKRSTTNAVIVWTHAMARVVAALPVMPASSQNRRVPGKPELLASSAPAR